MKKLLVSCLIISVIFSCKKDTEETSQQAEITPMEKNLNKYVSVKLTADLSKLTENERRMLPLLIEASQIMDELFWYEAYGDKNALLSTTEDTSTKKFIEINYANGSQKKA